jgi:hypothetical protein
MSAAQKQTEIQNLIGSLLQNDQLDIKKWVKDGEKISLTPDSIARLSPQDQERLLADLVATIDQIKSGKLNVDPKTELEKEVSKWIEHVDTILQDVDIDALIDRKKFPNAGESRPPVGISPGSRSPLMRAFDMVSGWLNSLSPDRDRNAPMNTPATATTTLASGATNPAPAQRTPPPPPPPMPTRPQRTTAQTQNSGGNNNNAAPAQNQAPPRNAPAPINRQAIENALKDGDTDLTMPSKIGGNDKLWFAHPTLQVGWLQVRPGNDNDIMQREIRTIETLRALNTGIPVANVFNLPPPRSLTIEENPKLQVAAENIDVNQGGGGVWMEKVDIATSKKPKSMVAQNPMLQAGLMSNFVKALKREGINLENAEAQLRALAPNIEAICRHVGEIDLAFTPAGEIRLLDVAPAANGQVIASGKDGVKDREAIEEIKNGINMMIEAIREGK